MEKHMKNDDESFEGQPDRREIITITDTHNDYEAILRNLQIHNIIDENGEWKEGMHNVQVIHTGDVVNKKNPDKKSLEYIFHLKATAPESCSVEILAGNHEMEYLVGMKGVAEEGSERKLIEGMSLLNISGPVLFLHGYPTRKLLRWVLSYVEDEGYSIEDAIGEINKQFSEALEESSSGYNNKLKHFLFGDKEKKKPIETNVTIASNNESDSDSGEPKIKPLFRKVLPADYYQKHGKEISELLAKLGIEIVVHGHARTAKGMQRIGEFSKNLPNVTLIDNDVAISEFKSTKPGEPTVGNKWGSTKIIMENTADGKSFVREMSFVNKETFTNKNL